MAEQFRKDHEETLAKFQRVSDPDEPEETATLTDFAVLKVHNVQENRWGIVAPGIVRILRIKETGRYRLVMRNKDDFNKVLLNFYVVPKLKMVPSEKQPNIQIRELDNYAGYPESTPTKGNYLLLFLTPELRDECMQKLTEAQQANSALIKK